MMPLLSSKSLADNKTGQIPPRVLKSVRRMYREITLLPLYQSRCYVSNATVIFCVTID